MKAFLFAHFNYKWEQRLARLVQTAQDAGFDVRIIVPAIRSNEDPQGRSTPGVINVGSHGAADYARKALSYFRRNYEKGDVCMSFLTTGGLTAVMAKRISGAPVFSDYTDLPQSYFTKDTPQDSWKQKLLRKRDDVLNRVIFKQSDVVISPSETLLEMLEEKYGHPKDAFILRNSPLTQFFRPSGRKQEKKTKTVFHLGSISRHYGVDTLLEAASILKDRQDFRFVFMGYGAKTDEQAVQQAADRSRGRIRLQPQVPYVHVARTLEKADVGIVAFKDYAFTRIGAPNKLFEYMAAGLVPVCSDLPEIRRICGSDAYYFKSADAQDLADKIQRALDHPKASARMVRNNLRKMKTAYSFEKQSEKLGRVMRRLSERVRQR
ncbi:glycosyltransferase family 4 protein [Candidatus Micrarchaeota archaeon]|nr:glycosyltransferase family 4 protein [Candidatus Micrarchaeota archaeon]